MTQKKKAKRNKETDDPSCMKNLQVYQLMRLITIILPITDHTVIYIILKGSHSLSVQAIPWARPSSAVQGFLTVGKSVMETSIISHKTIYRTAIKCLLLAGKFSFHVNVVFDPAINRTQTDKSSVNPSTWPETKK